MNGRSEDRNAQQLFRLLKREEEAVVPAFAEVLGGGEKQPRVGRRPLRLAGAVTLALCFAGSVFLYRLGFNPRQESVPGPDLSVFRWQSPTGFLLRFPGRKLAIRPLVEPRWRRGTVEVSGQ